MSSLYKQLANVYEAMYQTFINYNDEYEFYSLLLKKYHCTHVLEIGCGSGHLASPFIKNGFQYCGIDLSEYMLSIARENNPGSTFIKADMRNFILLQKVNAAIITGRTLSYLTGNEDVAGAFNAVYKNLETGGVICFDFIDAARFIPQIINGKNITHRAGYQNKNYVRHSKWSVSPLQSGAFNWHSLYYEEQDNNLIFLGEDDSTIRAFTKDEISLFLQQAGFTIKEMIDRPSYAFDTYVALAQK